MEPEVSYTTGKIVELKGPECAGGRQKASRQAPRHHILSKLALARNREPEQVTEIARPAEQQWQGRRCKDRLRVARILVSGRVARQEA